MKSYFLARILKKYLDECLFECLKTDVIPARTEFKEKVLYIASYNDGG